MFYVYQYVDCITQQPFYVGKGTGKRRLAHLDVAKKRLEGKPVKGRPSLCELEIMAMLARNAPPTIEVLLETSDEDEAYALEEKLVDQHGRKGIDAGGSLTNRARGGRGGRAYRLSDEARQRIIDRNKLPHSHERKIANSNAQRDKEVSTKVMTFQSPTGEIFRVKEWQDFLNKHGLSYNLVRHAGAVIKKGPNAGWTLLKKERFYCAP